MTPSAGRFSQIMTSRSGFSIGKRPQQHGMHDRKNSRIGADSQRQRQHDGCRQSGLPGQQAPRVPQVVHQAVHTHLAGRFRRISWMLKNVERLDETLRAWFRMRWLEGRQPVEPQAQRSGETGHLLRCPPAGGNRCRNLRVGESAERPHQPLHVAHANPVRDVGGPLAGVPKSHDVAVAPPATNASLSAANPWQSQRPRRTTLPHRPRAPPQSMIR